MVDFFGHQDRARRNTARLIFYFIVAAGLTICFVYLALAAILLYRERVPGSIEWLWDSRLFLWASGGTLAILALGSVFKIIELSAGGKVIAESLGGRLLDQSTRDSSERKVLNVVEEMALASGVPVPDVYLLDRESGINAFAAGTSISNAVIGVTRGCIETLDRDELQGVMAHEFSHILNGDMKINLRLTGWIHGLLCIAILGRILLYFGGASRSSRGESKGGNPLPIFGLALMVIGGIGMLFSKLIKAAVSRQREFLADASAVQFTRNPNGIAGALKKIGGLHSKLDSPKAEEASHLFFGNGLASGFFASFSTHPPLVDRIRRIDPSFKGKFDESNSRSKTTETQLVSQLSADAEFSQAAPIAPPPVRANRVMDQIGQIDREHINYASELVAGLPPVIVQAVHEPFGAVALCYALLLSSDSSTRKKQMEILVKNLDSPLVKETVALSHNLEELPARTRIPLIEMALPALRKMAPSQYVTFVQSIKALSTADRQIDLFEFSLEKILCRYLEPAFVDGSSAAVRFHTINPLLDDCNVLLSALAYLSHEDAAEVRKAYSTGVRHLNVHRSLSQIPFEQCDLGIVEKAMDRLAVAHGRVKQRVVNACAEAVTADGEIHTGEAELLRAICAALDIPCPPLL